MRHRTIRTAMAATAVSTLLAAGLAAVPGLAAKAAVSSGGITVAYFGQLAGNFHQLQELKAAYPNLKILLSIGGWTYSKYFSNAVRAWVSGDSQYGIPHRPHGSRPPR